MSNTTTIDPMTYILRLASQARTHHDFAAAIRIYEANAKHRPHDADRLLALAAETRAEAKKPCSVKGGCPACKAAQAEGGAS